MKEQERQLADIERDEQWLQQFSAPQPDAVTLERIKFVVRQTCQGDDAPSPPGTDAALAATKMAVRRELAGTASAVQPVVFRPWVPVALAAAAVAFAFVTLWGDTDSGVVRDPELAVFIDVMTRPADETMLALLELENDILSLTADYDDRLGGWNSPLLFEVGDVLDQLSREAQGSGEES